MKKSILQLALSALEVKLLNTRQQFKRDKLDDDVDSINVLLEETRQHITELSYYSQDKINLK
tara:strand:+ start:247 stop:432 length:186 start_codon:yes stop_codon:yes gene_type:complete